MPKKTHSKSRSKLRSRKKQHSKTKSKSRSHSKSTCSSKKTGPIIGIATFLNPKVQGTVTIKQGTGRTKSTIITINLSGLEPNRKYACHIHEAGDLSHNKCSGACSHYNPFNEVHGGLTSRHRHVGDLGNITTNQNGQAKMKLRTGSVKLQGRYSVIGRSIVIHEGVDDLGKGGTEESLKTGSAGGRIGCAVIGYSQNSRLYF